ncbi:MAG TPA: hydrogenase iron-sulfur subunit [Dissulfurispiraceae bacterium]|nr:hydrogenase iron-sulfur subunit [Dissulfurispiraceae bacterium]
MDKKYALYICTGCSIGESVNVEKMATIAKNAHKIPLIKTHFALCGKEGVELIKNDIATEGVNTLILAACSQRVKFEEFDFPGCIVERSPIRELAVWTQEAGSPFAQLAAEDYMKMSIFKAQKGDLPEPYKMETVKTILVIGGGVSGMKAALEAANTGAQVCLVEKEAKLGGFANSLYKKIPTSEYYKEPLIVDTDIESMIKAVESNPNIKVYKSSKVEKTDGMPGAFDVTISTGDKTEVVKIGSVILAAGWKPYDAKKLTHLGYGKLKNVVTNIQFEEIAKKGKILRPSDNRPAKKVAFIQCAGQRDPNHLSYCSAMCCATSLKQAKYVRQDEDAVAMILYKDIRTPGRLEYYYKEAQNDPGVMLTKCEVKSLTEAAYDNVYIEMKDSLIGDVTVEADLVVLATGMVPATLEDPVLNLAYRQGPGLPDLDLFNGFADSNFICFQYETRRTGVYAAGAVKQPMNMAEAQEDATGAALKAIQANEHAAVGMAVHPRAWDVTFPDPFMTKCTACKRCTEECPFGAIDEDEKGTPFYKIGRCRRCGTCMGACPERIVSFKDFHVDMIGTMMKNVSVPDDEDQPRIMVLCCENDAYPAIDTSALQHMKIDPAVRIIQLRCMGAVNLVWIADAFSRGIDGILMLGCKYGDNYQCHMAKGSELANYRLSKVKETLDKLQLEADRVGLVQLAIDDYGNLPQIITDFVDKVKAVGPNPFKGF